MADPLPQYQLRIANQPNAPATEAPSGEGASRGDWADFGGAPIIPGPGSRRAIREANLDAANRSRHNRKFLGMGRGAWSRMPGVYDPEAEMYRLEVAGLKAQTADVNATYRPLGFGRQIAGRFLGRDDPLVQRQHALSEMYKAQAAMYRQMGRRAGAENFRYNVNTGTDALSQVAQSTGFLMGGKKYDVTTPDGYHRVVEAEGSPGAVVNNVVTQTGAVGTAGMTAVGEIGKGLVGLGGEVAKALPGLLTLI